MAEMGVSRADGRLCYLVVLRRVGLDGAHPSKESPRFFSFSAFGGLMNQLSALGPAVQHPAEPDGRSRHGPCKDARPAPVPPAG